MSHKVYIKIEFDNIIIYDDITHKEHLLNFIHDVINETFIKGCGYDVDVYEKVKIELIIHYNNLMLSVDLNLKN